MPEQQPPPRPDAECAGRWHTYPTGVRPRRERSRDLCPERPRLLDPEHEAFATWFVTYWRSHGAQLLADETTTEEA
jgi:hypothetical protein